MTLVESTMAVLQSCATYCVKTKRKGDATEEGSMMLSKDKPRIKRVSLSQGPQGRENSRPLLSPSSCCNKCGTI